MIRRQRGVDTCPRGADTRSCRRSPRRRALNGGFYRIGKTGEVFVQAGRSHADDEWVMRTIPKKYAPKILFFETHLAPWAEHAEEIGTTDEMIALLAAQTAAAREAYQAQQRAITAAQSATLGFQIAREAMQKTGQSVIEQIRVKAAMEGNGVYALAQIASPADASPIDLPGRPSQLTTELTAIGSLKLRWKCKNPRNATGTMYRIGRMVYSATGETIGSSGFEHVGIVGKKAFEDVSIPRGAAMIIYQIQAFRSTGAGPSVQFNVNFGSGKINPAMLRPDPTVIFRAA